jgi:recombination protein RecA
VVKNKVAPPFRKVELEIMFGKGISASGSLIDAAVKYEIIDKKGAWYTWGEEKVGQGRDNAKLFIEQNPDVAATIEKKVREAIFVSQHPEPVPIVQGEADARLASMTVSPVEPAKAEKAQAKTAEPAARGPGRPPKQASPTLVAGTKQVARQTASDKAAIEDEGLF